MVLGQYHEHGEKIDLKGMPEQGVFDPRILLQVGVIDAQGLLAQSNLPFNGRVNLADREHFKAHLAPGSDALFISRPVLGRASGKWSIQLSRRITRANGEFGGVVVASLDPRLFHPFFCRLLPVVLLIAVGLIACRAGWIRAEATKDLSNLVFMVLTPALLFRTMSTVHVEQLNFKPVAIYFVAAALLFSAMLAWHGATRRATVLALAASFGNTVTIGIPLIGLAYGDAGLVTLFTLVSVHALLLLTLGTVVLELAVAREETAAGNGGGRHMMLTVLGAVRNDIVHPVPLPIIAGLLFAQTGLVIPAVLDRPLQLLGNAFGPVALVLVLVGVTLTHVRIGAHFKGALGLTLVKNLAFPALVAVLGGLLGLSGLPLTVMIVAASLPIGANVFMFSQRYAVAQELVTASVAVSTALGLVSISLVMALVSRL
jgi:hypothetical protein